MAFDLLRTMLAVCALYAFVVDGFAVGASAAAAHRGVGAFCGGGPSGPHAPDNPSGHGSDCCVACSVSGIGTVPAAASALLSPPGRLDSALTWLIERTDTYAGQRLPFLARGPPAV